MNSAPEPGTPRYVIYSPPFKEDGGGVVVLQKLCELLIEEGWGAFVWYWEKPAPAQLTSPPAYWQLARYLARKILRPETLRVPPGSRIARWSDLDDAIVVYPEIVSGNPLGARRVARWFLNKPGAITGEVNYGPRELYFYYLEHFNDWELNPHWENRLNVVNVRRDIYQMVNDGDREGTCYLVRKGADRNLDQHEPGAICIDGMSHCEVARVFNQCRYFVSYDLYSMYSRYAAMCGCIPVVIPRGGLPKEEWRPEIGTRYGIAYGWDDIDWAVRTRDDMLQYLDDCEREGRNSVRNFIAKTSRFFGLSGVGSQIHCQQG